MTFAAMEYNTFGRTLIFAVALMGLPTGSSYPQARPTLCDQPLDDNISVMYARISRLPGLTMAPSRNPDFDVISGPGQLWNFTKTTHPAYPSVACRRLVRDQDGDFRVETQLSCNAAKPECDKLAADYLALDKEMTDALKQGD